MKWKFLKYSQGLTLIEVLLYSFFVTIFLTSIAILANSIIDTDQRLNYKTELTENERFLQQKIKWAVVGATQINSPPDGSSASTLSLGRPGGETLVFDLADNIVRLKTGLNAPLPLTNDWVTVSSLTFTNYTLSASTKNTIRVTAKLTDKDPIKTGSASLDFFVSIQ